MPRIGSGSYTETVELVTIRCGGCGIVFGMPEFLYDDRAKNGGNFYCPNGHSRVFTEPQVEKLKKQLESANAARTAAEDQRRAAEKQVSVVRGQLTKARNRAKNGVCPCCYRTFQQLARHMAVKHPDFDPEKGTP